jgi:hypothetical protein
VISRLAGALIRGALVAFLVAFPGLSLPVESNVAINLYGFLSLIAGAIVWIEYAFDSPNLIEFRFCPPYNRLRWGILMLILVLLVHLYPHRVAESKFYLVAFEISKHCLYLWNFEYSPVPVLALELGRGDPDATVQFARMAALSLSLSILYSMAYIIASRGFRAHLEPGTFNFYMNLPTTTLSEDKIPRLQLKALAVLSVVLGLTLPFVVPVFLQEFGGMIMTEPLAYRPAVVWIIALWAWVPGIAVLRGVALYSVSKYA